MPTRRNRVASSVFSVALQAAKSLPALGDGVSGRDERQSRLGAKSKMQSAVTNGAASRAHRISDAAISAGLAPEGNLAIAERGNGRRNRPYKCGSTVAPFVTAIYNSIKASSK